MQGRPSGGLTVNLRLLSQRLDFIERLCFALHPVFRHATAAISKSASGPVKFHLVGLNHYIREIFENWPINFKDLRIAKNYN